MNESPAHGLPRGAPPEALLELKERLHREILLHNGAAAAGHWRRLHEADPEFVFPIDVQHYLCRILMQCGRPEESRGAYEAMIRRHPPCSATLLARLEFGRLCVETAPYRAFAIQCLREFLAAQPSQAQHEEAQNLIDQIQLAAVGVEESKAEEIPAPPAPQVAAPETREFEQQTRFMELEKFKREQDERQKQRNYEALLDRSQFSVLLPPRKRIHFDELCAVVSKFLEIPEDSAKRKLRAGKGIVLDGLSYEEMVDFYHLLADSPQQFMFVRDTEESDFGPMDEILSARADETSARITTERAQFRIEWEHVALLSAGKVRDANGPKESVLLVADILVSQPRHHLRLLEKTFNFRSWGLAPNPPWTAFRQVVLDWRDKCPKAIRSHTVEQLSKHPTSSMPFFDSIKEFDDYTSWLCRIHFGEKIDPSRRRAKAATQF